MMLFGKKTPRSLALSELDDIEREEYVLRKNMTHDRHRLAYLEERRKALEAEHVEPMERSERCT